MKVKVNDRGTMKWVSLMLPEHVELLNEVFTEYKEKPLLDEQKQSDIDATLKRAIKYDKLLEMTYYYNGEYRKALGKLKKIDQFCGYILLKNEDGRRISLTSIIDVKLVCME